MNNRKFCPAHVSPSVMFYLKGDVMSLDAQCIQCSAKTGPVFVYRRDSETDAQMHERGRTDVLKLWAIHQGGDAQG